MPFLEYIAMILALLAIIIGIVWLNHKGLFNFYGFFRVLVTGIFYGIISVSPIMLIVAVLGMVKRNHLLVLVILGTELIAHIMMGCLGFDFKVISVICYVGIIIWYILTFIKKIDFEAIQQRFNKNSKNTIFEAPIADKSFCSQCGTECSVNISYCPKCGNKLK